MTYLGKFPDDPATWSTSQLIAAARKACRSRDLDIPDSHRLPVVSSLRTALKRRDGLPQNLQRQLSILFLAGATIERDKYRQWVAANRPPRTNPPRT